MASKDMGRVPQPPPPLRPRPGGPPPPRGALGVPLPSQSRDPPVRG